VAVLARLLRNRHVEAVERDGDHAIESDQEDQLGRSILTCMRRAKVMWEQIESSLTVSRATTSSVYQPRVADVRHTRWGRRYLDARGASRVEWTRGAPATACIGRKD
jgi:hypothetical protein